MAVVNRVSILVLAGLLVAQFGAARLPKIPAPDGQYVVSLGGFYSGSASAAKHGNRVTISGMVQDDDGGSGTISATLDMRGNYFTGAGTLMGKQVALYGRIDDRGGVGPGGLKAARIIGGFLVDDGHRGRLAGAIPRSSAAANSNGSPRE